MSDPLVEVRASARAAAARLGHRPSADAVAVWRLATIARHQMWHSGGWEEQTWEWIGLGTDGGLVLATERSKAGYSWEPGFWHPPDLVPATDADLLAADGELQSFHPPLRSGEDSRYTEVRKPRPGGPPRAGGTIATALEQLDAASRPEIFPAPHVVAKSQRDRAAKDLRHYRQSHLWSWLAVPFRPFTDSEGFQMLLLVWGILGLFLTGGIGVAARSLTLFLILYLGPIVVSYGVLVVKDIRWLAGERRRLWPKSSWGNGDSRAGAVEGTAVPGRVVRPQRRSLVAIGGLALGVITLVAFAVSGHDDAPSSALGYELARVRGAPVRWDPCDGPIRVAVNYGNLTPAYRQRAFDAMQYGIARVSQETGLDFVLAGETDRIPNPRSSKGRRTDAEAVVIGFLPAGTALMAGTRDDVAARLSTTAAEGSEGWGAISAADVHVRSKAGSYQVAVLEGLARASGLRPVAKASGPGVLARNPQGADYGEGDMAGLEAVGASHGCLE